VYFAAGPKPRTGGEAVPAQGVSQRCAAFAGGIALLAIAGWVSGVRLLAGQWDGAIPMAPSSALAVLYR